MSFYGWKPYVSVAARRQKAEKAAAKASKSGVNLAPVPAYRGAIAKTFWGKNWCDNLERYSDYANRLPRGRSYVRNGSVIDLQITAGKVHAHVMGSALYTVTIKITPVAGAHWQNLCKACAGSINSLVEILQGKLSASVMEHICKPAAGLFPSPKEITLACSCPDSASMCKHVAAVLYAVGARLDQQPELLFGLRHVDPKDLIAAAGAGLQHPARHSGSGKVLRDASLADVFGIDMTDDNAPVKAVAKVAKPAAPKKSAGKAAKKVAGKPARKVAAKKPAGSSLPAKKIPTKKAPVKKTPVKQEQAKALPAPKARTPPAARKELVVKAKK